MNTALQTATGTRRALFLGTAGKPPAPRNALSPDKALHQIDLSSRKEYRIQHDLRQQQLINLSTRSDQAH